MAYDEGLAELLRGDLADREGITERKMFGELVFLLHGNMICGVHKGGGMFRVGKENVADALAMEGVSPMELGGRRMGGVVAVTEEAMADEARRGALMRLALTCVAVMPSK